MARPSQADGNSYARPGRPRRAPLIEPTPTGGRHGRDRYPPDPPARRAPPRRNGRGRPALRAGKQDRESVTSRLEVECPDCGTALPRCARSWRPRRRCSARAGGDSRSAPGRRRGRGYCGPADGTRVERVPMPGQPAGPAHPPGARHCGWLGVPGPTPPSAPDGPGAARRSRPLSPVTGQRRLPWVTDGNCHGHLAYSASRCPSSRALFRLGPKVTALRTAPASAGLPSSGQP